MVHSRRAFIMSAATVGSATALLGRAAFGQARSPGAPGDPVIEQIVQEVFAALRELEGSPQLRPDAVRSLAVAARLAAAHVRATQLDRRVSAGLRRVQDRIGRERLIDQASEPALTRRDHDMQRSFGLRGHYGGETFSREQYQQTINAMLVGREAIGTQLDRIAASLDVRYRKLAARAASGGRAVPVQQDECALWQELCSSASLLAQIQCTMLSWLPEFGGIVCVMAQAWAATCCYMSATCGR